MYISSWVGLGGQWVKKGDAGNHGTLHIFEGAQTHSLKHRRLNPALAPLRPADPFPYLSLPPLFITLATGQGVLYSPLVMNTMAISPLGLTVPVMLLQARVLWRAGGVDAVRRVLKTELRWLAVYVPVPCIRCMVRTVAGRPRSTG